MIVQYYYYIGKSEEMLVNSPAEIRFSTGQDTFSVLTEVLLVMMFISIRKLVITLFALLHRDYTVFRGF